MSLFLRNLFFTIVQPGIVAGLIPFLVAGNDFKNTLASTFSTSQYFGIGLFLIGFCVMAQCILSFAIKGKGTLSPADPTKHLVISGLYKYSRNPMYVGVMLMLIGETFFTENLYLLIYSSIVCIGFHLFIIFKEEPRLKKDFGQEYEYYKTKVRRWI